MPRCKVDEVMKAVGLRLGSDDDMQADSLSSNPGLITGFDHVQGVFVHQRTIREAQAEATS